MLAKEDKDDMLFYLTEHQQQYGKFQLYRWVDMHIAKAPASQ